MFDSHYFRMRVFTYNIQLPVLYMPGFPKETQESFIFDRFSQQQGIPVSQLSRELLGRHNAVKVKPRIATMDRDRRRYYRIMDKHDRIAWDRLQINDGLGLGFIDGGQIPIALFQLFYQRRIIRPEPFVFLYGQFQRTNLCSVQGITCFVLRNVQ